MTCFSIFPTVQQEQYKQTKKNVVGRGSKKKYLPKRGRLVRPVPKRKQYRPKKAVYIPKKKIKAKHKLTVASLRAGMNVSNLGPMAFSVQTIKSCQMKCSIMMSGAGGQIKVKFFKIHYGNKLTRSTGRVYISGLVQKTGGQTTILLNGVR